MKNGARAFLVNKTVKFRQFLIKLFTKKLLVIKTESVKNGRNKKKT